MTAQSKQGIGLPLSGMSLTLPCGKVRCPGTCPATGLAAVLQECVALGTPELELIDSRLNMCGADGKD